MVSVETESVCHPHKLSVRLCTHFPHDVAAMDLDRDLADAELTSDLLGWT
jgi:hypothetical protein